VRAGSEERTIVAGIRKFYTAEELVGKQIVLVCNLEPAVIRGVESAGMLLAASDGEKIVLIRPEKEISSGAIVR
jgi:methionyl-tRNA synthetase